MSLLAASVVDELVLSSLAIEVPGVIAVLASVSVLLQLVLEVVVAV